VRPAPPRKKHGAVAAEVRATADFSGAYGAFRFIERIERDHGPSELYRAVWTGAPSSELRSCLIKRLRPELCDSPAFQKMFADETRTLTALGHGNIVRVYSHGQIDGLPYLALEPLDGWSLQHLVGSMKRGGQKLPIEVAAFIAREVATALAHAHEACDAGGQPLGIIHRDVRPANIMLLRTGAVKLIDFGVARVASFVSTSANASFTPGKPSYLSPEQLAGRALDGRADLFSLGAVLWELLVGQPLFPAGSPQEMAMRLEQHPIARPASIRGQVPPALDALVVSLLERPLARRAASAAQVARELSAFVPADRDAARALASMVRDGLGPGPGVPAAAQRSLSRLLPPIRALLARGSGDGKAAPGGRRPTSVVAVDAVLGLRSRIFRSSRSPTSEATPQPPPPAPASAPTAALPAPVPRPWWLALRDYLAGPKARVLAVQAVAVAVIAFAGGALWHGPRPPAVSISGASPAPAAPALEGVVIEPIPPAPPAAAPVPPAPVAEPAKPVARSRAAAPARGKLHKRARPRRR
jgi:serine/threonine-protein kinase